MNDTTIRLPYDRTNPVWYDNDWTNDYVDFYLMALATAGDIDYRGISTSSSVPPYNRHMPAEDLDRAVRTRTEIVERGRASGFANVPDPVPGCRGHLVKPDSGKAADTQPLEAVGTRRIIEEAHKAGAKKPLVVLVGGPCTVVANAWLIDPSIAEKVIVAFLDNHNSGMTGYNGWADGWATAIVIQKLQLVQFTVESRPFAQVTKERLLSLPDTPAREYMLASKPDIVSPDGDCDGPAAIGLMRSDYVTKVNHVSFGGYAQRDGHEMPLFVDDPASRSIVCTEASVEVATDEWWRAVGNPAIWSA